MVLPVLLVVLALAVWVLACVAAQVRCVDAAAAAARVAARGDPSISVTTTVSEIAPRGARVRITRRRGEVEVVVVAVVRPFGRLVRLPGVSVTGRAVAVAEPGP